MVYKCQPMTLTHRILTKTCRWFWLLFLGKKEPLAYHKLVASISVTIFIITWLPVLQFTLLFKLIHCLDCSWTGPSRSTQTDQAGPGHPDLPDQADPVPPDHLDPSGLVRGGRGFRRQGGHNFNYRLNHQPPPLPLDMCLQNYSSTENLLPPNLMFCTVGWWPI